MSLLPVPPQNPTHLLSTLLCPHSVQVLSSPVPFVSLSLSCSLRAQFAVPIHLLSPHILSQLPDVLIKTVGFSFSLGVGGSRKPPWGCLPGAATSALCWTQPSARVGQGLVTDAWLNVHWNALGAGTLPAWPSLAPVTSTGTGICGTTRVTGAGTLWRCPAAGICSSTALHHHHHQWEDGSVVRVGHCTPN